MSNNISWLKNTLEYKKRLGMDTRELSELTAEEKAERVQKALDLEEKKRKVAEKSATNRKKSSSGKTRKDDIVKVALFERILKFLLDKGFYKNVAMSEDSKELVITTSQNVRYAIKITKKRG